MSDEYIRMKNFIEANSLLTASDSCLAAVSGGADSMCMLSLLADYCRDNELRLGVVTVDHGFRPEAKTEAAYVRNFCDDRGIPCVIKTIPPGECSKSEEAARDFRYKLIKEAAAEGGYNRIALAHNACDRAETMLFNLFRGTGITGLAGIRAQRDEFIRPILFMERGDIEEYLKQKNILFYTDSSNLGDDYARNRIRHHIIPKSREINSESIKHMNEAAESIAKAAAFIEKLTSEAFEGTVYEADGGICTDVDGFLKLDEVIQGSLVRRMITDMTPKLKDITAEHVASIISLAHRDSNGSIDLPYGITAFREYGRIRICGSRCGASPAADVTNEKTGYASENERASVEIALSGPEAELPAKLRFGNMDFSLRVIDAESLGGYEEMMASIPRNKYTKWFDCDKISKSVELRTRLDGDYLVIDGEGHRKGLNRCMIDLKIPEAVRDEKVLIADGDEILWIVGYRESYAYRIDRETVHILEINLLEGKNG